MKQNTEKKTLKERVIDNKGKILTIVSGTVVVIAGCVIYKSYKDNEVIKRIVEEGALTHAIDSVNRKVSYRENKRNNIKNDNPYNYELNEDYIRYGKELVSLYKDQEAFMRMRNKIKVKEV